MKSSLRLCVGMTALLASYGTAVAGDWTQLYGGISVGADAFTGSAKVVDLTSGQSLLKASGPFGADIGASLTIGADYQINRHWVIGGQFSYDWSRSQTEASIREQGITANASLMAIDRMWFGGARLGFLVTDQTLVYGLLGYSWLSVEDLKFSASNGGNTVSARLPLPSSQGVTIGGGIEHKLSHNVSLRAEYRLTDYGREIIFHDPGNNISVTGQAQSHVARLGAFYRFGAPSGEQAQAAAADTGTWSGGYLSVGVGLASYLRDLTIAGTSPGHVGDVAEVSGLGGGNMLIGLSAGYDFLVSPRVIAGIVVSIDAGTANHELAFSSQGNKATIDLLNQKYGWSIGGRAGYLFAPSLLGYVSAGFAQIQFEDATLMANGADIYRFPFSALNGVYAGVGFEKQLNARWLIKTEYQYSAFETFTVNNFAVGGDQARVTFDPSSHAVKLSVGYRFGQLGQ
ncbi:MAG: outer membrane protein [Hyphomicrobiaceae bacterium]